MGTNGRDQWLIKDGRVRGEPEGLTSLERQKRTLTRAPTRKCKKHLSVIPMLTRDCNLGRKDQHVFVIVKEYT
jgi:hypothetical protein